MTTKQALPSIGYVYGGMVFVVIKLINLATFFHTFIGEKITCFCTFDGVAISCCNSSSCEIDSGIGMCIAYCDHQSTILVQVCGDLFQMLTCQANGGMYLNTAWGYLL